MRVRTTVAAATVAVGVAAVPRAAHAYRPFDQTDADTAEVDTIELELGPVQLSRGGDTTTLEPGGVFNYGFAAGWELVVDFDALVPLSDLSAYAIPTDIMVKHVLHDGSLQDKSGPSVALELGPLLPALPLPSMHMTTVSAPMSPISSGSLVTDPDDVGGSAALIVSQKWPDFTIHVNGLVEYTRDRKWAATGGAILEGPGHWAVRPVAEGYVSREAGGNLYSGLAGAIWRWRDHVSFDAAARVERDENNVVSAQLRLGLTWVIPT